MESLLIFALLNNLGSRWKRFDLTYNVVNLPYDMHRQTVYNEFKRAFDYWSSVSPLRFRRVTSNADINVAFYSGRHGDSDPFGKEKVF